MEIDCGPARAPAGTVSVTAPSLTVPPALEIVARAEFSDDDGAGEDDEQARTIDTPTVTMATCLTSLTLAPAMTTSIAGTPVGAPAMMLVQETTVPEIRREVATAQ
jgi:hypothetical protein